MLISEFFSEAKRLAKFICKHSIRGIVFALCSAGLAFFSSCSDQPRVGTPRKGDPRQSAEAKPNKVQQEAANPGH
jgi:hypothetical protein